VATVQLGGTADHRDGANRNSALGADFQLFSGRLELLTIVAKTANDLASLLAHYSGVAEFSEQRKVGSPRPYQGRSSLERQVHCPCKGSRTPSVSGAR